MSWPLGRLTPRGTDPCCPPCPPCIRPEISPVSPLVELFDWSAPPSGLPAPLGFNGFVSCPRALPARKTTAATHSSSTELLQNLPLRRPRFASRFFTLGACFQHTTCLFAPK